MRETRVTLSLKYKAVVGGGLLLFALCALSAVFGSGGVIDLRDLHAEQAVAEQAAFDLAQHNAGLRAHLTKLEHDDAYLERVVRERLGWIKPGERVYRIADERR
jgi:cell division protein FtsB